MVDNIARAAVPLTGANHDYDGLLQLIGDCRLVLPGEASHGTYDFYRERARITQRLIDEKSFNAVGVEADWPDAYRANRYVLGQSADVDTSAALSDFKRFPAWMWRNADVVRFIEWLRPATTPTVTSKRKRVSTASTSTACASMEAVVAYLDAVDPLAARAARDRYSCFDHVSGEGPEYGHSVALNVAL